MKKFLVTPAHGRVFRRVDAYTRVLVAVPGQEIPWELAQECGLIEPEPEPAPEPSSKDEKPPPVKQEPAPSTMSYPTKTHKAV